MIFSKNELLIILLIFWRLVQNFQATGILFAEDKNKKCIINMIKSMGQCFVWLEDTLESTRKKAPRVPKF